MNPSSIAASTSYPKLHVFKTTQVCYLIFLQKSNRGLSIANVSELAALSWRDVVQVVPAPGPCGLWGASAVLGPGTWQTKPPSSEFFIIL